jgi:hypothetical protein
MKTDCVSELVFLLWIICSLSTLIRFQTLKRTYSRNMKLIKVFDVNKSYISKQDTTVMPKNSYMNVECGTMLDIASGVWEC